MLARDRLPEPPTSLAGFRLVGSRYRLLDLLGVGGMASVLRARDETSGQVVALKRLAPDFQGEADQLRFKREFHTLAQLRHPGVVEVYEYGVDAEGPFYTMELLEGADLSTLGVLAPERACRVLREVAETLAFLHTRRLLHRDLAPRNIRFDAKGRVRLIDFGILATVGRRGDGAGTPPFMAPESLRGLPLDPRTDLFGLGALAYRLLTGRNAYPAKRFTELEPLWSRPLAPPSRIVPEVPSALDALVLSLLSVDPLRRPRSAADAIEALDALVGGGTSHRRESAEGYLASAALVGRSLEMEALRGAVHATLSGEGALYLVEGPLGSGKSRLLREFGLEARVAGARVLEARAGELERAPYAGLEALLGALFADAPEEAVEAAQDFRAELGRLPLLAGRLDLLSLPLPGDLDDSRARFHDALTGWILAVARRRPLVLVLDDAQLCDEATLGVLHQLAEKAPWHPVLICLGRSTDQPTRTEDALAALRRQATRLRLEGLSETEVAGLLRVTFGEVPELLRLSRWMHQVAGGSPLHTLELSRHLVSRGALRYEGGLWLLADDRLEAETPRELSDPLVEWLADLPPEARALAEALSLHDGELSLRLCLLLAGGEEVAFRGLDALVEREVLVGGGDTYRFRHPALRDALRRKLPPEQRRALHLSVGRALQAIGPIAGNEAGVGYHLVQGGEDLEGALLLEKAGRRLFFALSMKEAIEPLQAALDVYERLRGMWLGRMVRVRYLLMVSTSSVACDLAPRHAHHVIEALLHSAGLSLARAPSARSRLPVIAAGLLRALLRWPLTPRPMRYFPPLRALAMLPFALERAAGASFQMRDLAGMRRWLQVAEIFTVPRSGYPKASVLILRSMLDFSVGQWGALRERAWETLRVLDDVPEPEREDLRYHLRVIRTELYMQLSLVAMEGEPKAFHQAVERMVSMNLRIFDSYIALVRSFHHRLRGEEDVARDFDARSDAALVRLGMTPSSALQRPLIEARGYALTRDVLGLRRALESLSRLSKVGGQVDDVIALTQGEYHRERGQLDEAMASLLRALELSAELPQTRQTALAALAETHLARGEVPEALQRAREAVAASVSAEGERTLVDFRAERVLALAEALDGHSGAAAVRLSALLGAAERMQNPLLFGVLHEARGSVALLSGDMAAYRDACAEVEKWFGATRNPVLLARAQRFQAQGAVRGAVPLEIASEVVTRVERNELPVGAMLDAAEPSEKPALALELLMSAADGAAGHLYRVEGGRSTLLASRASELPPDAVEGWVRRIAAQANAGKAPALGTIRTASGTCWHSLPLGAGPDGAGFRGVAFLSEGALRFREVPPEMLEEVGRALWGR